MKLSFNSYMVPSGARPGDVLCFTLVRFPAKVGGLNLYPPTVVDHECKTLSVPNVVARGVPDEAGAKPPVASPRTASGRPRRPSTTTAGGVAPTATAQSDLGALPDLVLEFEKTPVGSSFQIVVTPALDMFLVNTTATVDPFGQIQETAKKNNYWQSQPAP